MVQAVKAEVMEAPPAAPAPVVNDATALLAIIERAATDPSFDADKMERLLAMHERMSERGARAAYNTALAEMLPKLPVISEKGKIIVTDKKDKDLVIQSTSFARWEDINDVIKPILTAHGFGLTFRTGVATDGKIEVTGVLSHVGGHSEASTMTLPHDSTGSKNAVQAVGSSTSYGKRYVTMALLNITTRGEDDDADYAGQDGLVSEDQAGDIQALMEDVGADRGRFLEYMSQVAGHQIGAISEIPAHHFKRAMHSLHQKRAQRP